MITNSSVGGDPQKAATALCRRAEKGRQSMKKRKLDAFRSRGVGSNEGGYVVDLSSGEVIQPARVEAECFPKKSKHTDVTLQIEDQIMKIDHAEEATNQKIKWKRLITSILELNPDRVVKISKLQKLVSKSLGDAGIILDEAQLRDRLKHK
eukprot:TRINITY_DN2748_c2_g1_i1.p1 TRINITY_DN2748_c2_g1~~TRINITY_DN2748_c2_g1_i1.p1  ORF type:complete len:151 (-),score=33.72 TRINITY_DN2748_c2_g1_i1:628-1080(-)